MRVKRNGLSFLLCIILCISLVKVTAFAADNPAMLTVNGVDALTTSAGEGWSYDGDTNTLTLDGYNGGSIITGYMDLTVKLAEGSTNVVSTTDAYGIANYQDSFTSPYHDLHIVGSAGSTLNITSTNRAVSSKGNLSIENCTITAKNTAGTGAAKGLECVFAEGNINIDGSTLNVTAEQGVGIACYNYNTICDSTVTVKAGMIGIQANNRNLTIRDCVLDVTGNSTAALYSYFGTVQLSGCSGQLSAGTASVYAQNINGDSDTQLTNCDLALTAPYGVMTYSGILIDGGSLALDCTAMGIFSFSPSYDAEARLKGNASIECSSGTPQFLRVDGSYTADDSVSVDGVVLENTGDVSTMCILLVGDLTISADTSYGRNVLIPATANITVAPDASFDLSSAPTVTIDGTLTNAGKVTLNGGNTANHGAVYNYKEIVLADSQPIVNDGKIYSVCSLSFDLSPYGENGIVLHEKLDKTEEKQPTHLEEGNTAYYHCEACGKYFRDEAGAQETSPEDEVIPKLTEHSADSTTYHSDDNSHYHVCVCGDILDKASHTFEWVIDKEATKSEAGARHAQCKICGYAKAAEKIPATGSNDPSSPQTGDDTNIVGLLSVMILSGAALTTTVLYARKKIYC